VTTPIELTDELGDHSLGAAVCAWRDPLHRWCDLGDSERSGHHWTPL
jgi:hypothetical protein